MAMVARTDRAALTRARIASGGGAVVRPMARPMVRPMVRVTAGVRVAPVTPTRLELVPRRRRTARLIAVGAVLVFGLMFGAAAFQTQLAQRQLTLDKLDTDIRDANGKFRELSRQRAELRSPGRLAKEATALGMVPASDTKFMTLPPEVIAIAIESAGHAFDDRAATPDDPFEQIKEVKSVAGGARCGRNLMRAGHRLAGAVATRRPRDVVASKPAHCNAAPRPHLAARRRGRAARGRPRDVSPITNRAVTLPDAARRTARRRNARCRSACAASASSGTTSAPAITADDFASCSWSRSSCSQR